MRMVYQPVGANALGLEAVHFGSRSYLYSRSRLVELFSPLHTLVVFVQTARGGKSPAVLRPLPLGGVLRACVSPTFAVNICPAICEGLIFEFMNS